MKIVAKTMFILGILASVAIGLMFPYSEKLLGIPIATGTIIMAGFIVGLINLRSTKTNNFLITTILLLVVGNGGLLAVEGLWFMSTVMLNILAFVGPAAFLVALKAVYEMCSS